MHPFAVVRVRTRLFVCAVLALAAGALLAQPASAASPNLVISQVYGGGGNTGAQFTHDYIEIFNRGTTTVSLNHSLQYASATGTGLFGSSPTLITELVTGSIGPGKYLLVQEAAGAGNGVALPAPDVVDDTGIAMAAGAGKVALVSGTAPLGCNGAPPPATTGCNAEQLARIVDLIGYGSANFFEAAAAPTLSNTTAAFRALGGCQDTDNNGADFAAAVPAPRNSATTPVFCAGDAAPFVAATTPADNATGVALDSNVTITFSEPVNVTGAWFAITCPDGNHPATVSGGPTTFTLDPATDFPATSTCGVVVAGGQVSDQDDPPDTVVGNPTWRFMTASPPPPTVAIHTIQGSSHTSPFVGVPVTTTGIVTAERTNSFYMQDPDPDAEPLTSEGLLVFTSSVPTVNVGDSVRVSGLVTEFRPGGSSTANLTTTEITGPTIAVLSTGNPLPVATVLGIGGRNLPTAVIDDDSFAAFDPANDGIDFFETVEGMRVQVNNPVVVGPRNSNGEIWTLADDGAGASVRTNRGGIVIRDLGPEPAGDYASGDFNPERIQLDDAAGTPTPNVRVGDHFSGPAIGVVDFDFGNYEVHLTSTLTGVDGGLTRETTDAPGVNELSIATFNVENLGGNEGQAKYDALAAQIVSNMRSPDVVSLEEIQDNNGATNDSVVDANITLDRLVTAIAAAGGPTYQYRQINPVDDQDGGQPGGNIRVGFIFRTDRGLAFVDRPGGDSTTPTTVLAGPGGPQLSASPGRIDPANTAWSASRKPLAGEFTFRGERFFLITNHFNSKGGDNPLFGRFQPPVRTTEAQRHQQAQIVNSFVDSILAVDANANVVVLGDINDFEFSETMGHLTGAGVLHPLMSTLPQIERYSYVFEGNSQSLDHIVVSNSLFSSPFAYDPVHVNAEFFDQLSDHDPQVARFFVNTAPTADAGGPYTVAEGGSVVLSATGSDANSDALTYAWDLDNNGSFETAGQSPTYTAGDGPASATVRVQVSDGSATTVDEATVNVSNVAPTATFSAPAETRAGFPFTLSLTGASDPSAADTAGGFQYAFDCGNGYGAFGTSSTATCTPLGTGALSVGGRIRDKDGSVSEYRATVTVSVTFASLCDLVHEYTSDAKTQERLCMYLDLAAGAQNQAVKQSHLRNFRNEVDKALADGHLSADEAETVKRLSTRL
ncbi:MAG: endonuclease/exonuclease/phosphatase family [Desertimonas sp.]|nr:endonuclease/exonuclease/phosphatase family [Desertimonas sp.]